MTFHDANARGGGPALTEPAGESRGIQRGGFSPKVMEVLDRLPEEQRSLIANELRQKEDYVKTQRRRLQTEVQKAGVLDDWLKDPKFQRYVKARESGDLPTFFRDEIGADSRSQTNGAEADHEANPGGSAGYTELDEPGSASNGDAALRKENDLLRDRLESVESRVESHDQRQNEIVLDDFAKRFPDHELYHPAMQVARNRLGQTATLEDLYHLAKAEAQGANAENSRAGEATQAQTPPETAASPANSEQPPPVVGAQVGAAPDESQPRTVEEAWNSAKKELGIEGPLNFQFE